MDMGHAYIDKIKGFIPNGAVVLSFDEYNDRLHFTYIHKGRPFKSSLASPSKGINARTRKRNREQ